MDGELFGSFCEDYEGWTEVIFRRVDKEYARELKRVLCYKGVAMGRANKNLVPTLVDLLAQADEDPPEWEMSDLRSTVVHPESYAYRLQQKDEQGKQPQRGPHRQRSKAAAAGKGDHEREAQSEDSASDTTADSQAGRDQQLANDLANDLAQPQPRADVPTNLVKNIKQRLEQRIE